MVPPCFLLLALLPIFAYLAPNPFLDEIPKTGLIDVGRGELFYWLFEPRKKVDANTPIIMWLTGGPGCSSSVALFYENGPFTMTKQAILQRNNYSWNDQAYLLYMDQPVGTGFSTVKNFRYVVNEEQISVDMYNFLVSFFLKYPTLAKRPLYVTGESYAGHYIPAIGAYLAKHSHPNITLSGLAIGNGLVDPLSQYGRYSEFSYENKIIPYFWYLFTRAGFYICQALIYTNLWPIAMAECQVNMMLILGPTFYPLFNPYDYTIKCEKPPLCYDFGNVKTFLDKKEVRQIIKTSKNYEDCNMIVHTFLLADWWFDFSDDVAYVLDTHKIPVMVYSGDRDFICNWRGGEAWVHNMKWSGKDKFNEVAYSNWTIDKNNVGQMKAYDGLSFIRIYNAGHMAPMDKPIFNLAMINAFINGKIHQNAGKIKLQGL